MTGDAPGAPLVLHVRPGKIGRGGRASIVLGLLLIGVCTLVMVYGTFFPAFLYIFLALGVLLLVFGAMSLGMARGRPVGLRVDAHGVSGYYVPTLDWTEIVRIDRTEPGSTMLGIELFDRIAVRARQRSVISRLNLSLPLSGNWHILVPGDVLEADLDAVIATARTLHTAAIDRDRRKTSM